GAAGGPAGPGGAPGRRRVRPWPAHLTGARGPAAAIYPSPLTRPRRTAEAIGALPGHKPVLLDDLREMHFGAVDGLSFRELRERHSDLLAADDDPEAEDFAWPSADSRPESPPPIHPP